MPWNRNIAVKVAISTLRELERCGVLKDVRLREQKGERLSDALVAHEAILPHDRIPELGRMNHGSGAQATRAEDFKDSLSFWGHSGPHRFVGLTLSILN
jgi:hypothetical protein